MAPRTALTISPTKWASRDKAARGTSHRKPLTTGGRRYAGEQVKAATAFLRWLSEMDLDLASCRQADIDAWHAESNEHARTAIRAFLQWCVAASSPAASSCPLP